MSIQNYAFGKKIKRTTVENNDELVAKIVDRANNAEGQSRSISESTAIKRYVKYVNSLEPKRFAHLYSPEDEVYFANEPEENKTSTMSLEDVEVKLTKMKDQEFDADLFVPIKSNTALDRIISNKEGIMPATNTIVLGDPGIGKTTVMLDLLSNIQQTNPDKKCLFISGEMNAIDLAEYMERLPGAENLDIFFTMDYEENCHLAFQKVLQQGWDVVLFDSFDEIKETVNEDLGLSSTKAEKWMIDIMVQQNLANNELKKNTSFLAIQQVTKGGKFVGSNKLKHNTTAMLEIRYDRATGEPKLFYTKNRRGNTDHEMFFSITSEGVFYNIAKFTRELDWKKKMNDEEENDKQNANAFNEIFKLHEDENGMLVQDEIPEPENLEEEEFETTE